MPSSARRATSPLATEVASASLSIRNGAWSAWRLVTPYRSHTRVAVRASSLSPRFNNSATAGSPPVPPASTVGVIVILPLESVATCWTNCWTSSAERRSGTASRRVTGGSLIAIGDEAGDVVPADAGGPPERPRTGPSNEDQPDDQYERNASLDVHRWLAPLPCWLRCRDGMKRGEPGHGGDHST